MQEKIKDYIKVLDKKIDKMTEEIVDHIDKENIDDTIIEMECKQLETMVDIVDNLQNILNENEV